MNQQDIDQYLDNIISTAEKGIDRSFAAALKEILNEIARMFEKYANGDGTLTWTDMNKFNRLEKEMATISGSISAQYQDVLKALQNLTQTVYLENYMRSSYLYELAAQTALGVSVPSIKTINKAITNPIDKLTLPALMTAHRTEIINKLHILISQSLMSGEGYAQMARRIQGAVGFSTAKARNVARTEAGRVQTQARLDSAELAAKHADLQKVWMSTLDFRTRPDHRKLDGQEADKDGYFHIHEFKAKGPHLFGVAKEDCNCRCTVIMKVNGQLPDTRRARDYTDANYQQRLADRMDQLMADEGMTEKQAEKQAKKEIVPPSKAIPFQTYKEWLNGKKKDKINGQKLNYEEEHALMNYLSSDSYKVNEKLRRNLPLGEHESMVQNLDSALKKLPKYQGTVFRDVYFSDDGGALEYYNLFVDDSGKLRSKIPFKEFISSSKDSNYNQVAQFQLEIKSSKGRDLKGINDREKEVLFMRNSEFKILNQRFKDGRVIFELEEI